jgi:hypothetical protein
MERVGEDSGKERRAFVVGNAYGRRVDDHDAARTKALRREAGERRIVLRLGRLEK